MLVLESGVARDSPWYNSFRVVLVKGLLLNEIVPSEYNYFKLDYIFENPSGSGVTGLLLNGGGVDSQWVALKVYVHCMLWVQHGADSNIVCIYLIHVINHRV